jgi:hypothetical protein
MFASKQRGTVIAEGLKIVGTVTAEGLVEVNGQTPAIPGRCSNCKLWARPLFCCCVGGLLDGVFGVSHFSLPLIKDAGGWQVSRAQSLSLEVHSTGDFCIA